MKERCMVLLLAVLLSCTDKNPIPKDLPDGIRDRIRAIKKGEVSNPPAQVYRYQYRGAEVYYFSARCCDIPSQLVDRNGNLLCAPDGGFTGRGDGRCPDFAQEATRAELVWKDNR